MNFKKIVPIFAIFLFATVAFALMSGTLTVDTCSIISGTVTINNCGGLNTSDDSQDVVVNKNAEFATAMSSPVNAQSYSNVSVTFRHGGQNGINGNLGVTFYDTSSGINFCTQDTSTANTKNFVTDSVIACTPTGGWTQSKLNNLGIILNSFNILTAT